MQKTTVVHFRDVKEHWNALDQCWDDPKYVYIGRKVTRHRLPESKWANPYKISPRLSRTEVIERYRRKISLYVRMGHQDYRTEELRGKVLVCWCKGTGKHGEDMPCHGDVLVEFLEGIRMGDEYMPEQPMLITLAAQKCKLRRCRRPAIRKPVCLEVFQPPMMLHDHIAWQLERVLSRMLLDDALVASRKEFTYRLEYLYLAEGLPHFRLTRLPRVAGGDLNPKGAGRGRLLGVVDVRSWRKLPDIRRDLGAYLAGLGFTGSNVRLIKYGAVHTHLDMPKRAPKLVGFSSAPALASVYHEAAYSL